LNFASLPGRVAFRSLSAQPSLHRASRAARVPRASRGGAISLDELEVGQKFTGTVVGVRDFGAFVDFGAERQGLVHISKLANQRINNIYDHVDEGQELDVWISQVRDGKVGLTAVPPVDLGAFADASSSEWQKGVVGRLAPFGAFVTVTLPDGASAEGLVHVSQLRDGFVENIDDEDIEVGQEVQARIISVDMGSGKMSLSMKEEQAPREPADFSAFEGVSSDQWLTGKVARTASFGAFVTVTAPEGEAEADGLVHVTAIRSGYVESVEDELEVGQEVQVRVLSVDMDAGKMSLSMREEGDEDGDEDGGEEEE